MRLRPFELALIIIFAVLAGLSLLLLSSFSGGGEEEITVGKVVIWGTLESGPMDQLLKEWRDNSDAYNEVSYRRISEDDFEQQLITALADGTGPDVLLLPHEYLIDFRSRLRPATYDSYSRRDIQNNYIDGAQIFALTDGLYAYPVAVDPLLMYWNKSVLANAGYLTAPATWESLVNDYLPNLIQRDADRTINRAVVAMGRYENIRNAHGIVSTLLLQGGSALVTENGEEYIVELDTSVANTGRPMQAAADFYTRFSKPDNTLYSWNSTLGEDRNEFAAGDLLFYFGYTSEGEVIEKLNLNLSFDVAEIPQPASATIRRNYGRFYGLSLVRNSANPNGAALVITALGEKTTADRIASDYNMVPVYRTSVAGGSDNTYGRIAYNVAPITYGWLNPDFIVTKEIFSTMVLDIIENRFNVGDAVRDAIERLRLEYN